MSFSLDTRDIPTLVNYAAAKTHHDSQKPWRDTTNRPLERNNRKKKHVSIHMANNTVHCTLHSSNLVSFHDDGTVDVRMWQSISSQNFINAILPTHAYVQCNTGEPVAWTGYPWGDRSVGYLIDGSIATFSPDWKLQNPKPILWPTLNVKKANKLKKEYKFEDFKTWRRAYLANGGDVPRQYGRLNAYEVTEHLVHGPQKWVELAREATDSHVLACIYRNHKDVIDVEEREYFTSDRDYKNWLSLDAKYGWATITR